jgi:carbonic anhydrase
MIERAPGVLTPSRRLLVASAFGLLIAPHALAKGRPQAPDVAPADALRRLSDGNARYVAGRATHPDSGPGRRRAVAGGQHPFATILTCADSRTPPELIFDQGLGALFVVRVAGNVVDDPALASIEYSVIHLGSRLIMALGHQRCGAVRATLDALDGKASEADRDTRIGALANLIAPAARAAPPGPGRLEAAILANARRSAGLILSESRPLRARARDGRIEVVSAVYSLDDGRVSQVERVQA